MQIEEYKGKSANNNMNVIISPNIKKESVRIDPAGNIIDKKTKQVIEPVVPEYVAPEQSVAQPAIKPIEQPKPVSKIDEMINKKVEEMVARKIEEAFKNL